MNELISFLQEHYTAILALLACIIYFVLRFVKTGKSYDFLRWLLNFLDTFKLTPDRKSGGGKWISRRSLRD